MPNISRLNWPQPHVSIFSVWQIMRGYRETKLPFSSVSQQSTDWDGDGEETEREHDSRKQGREKYVNTGNETWEKKSNEYKTGGSSGGEPSLKPWLFWPLLLSRFGGLICRGGGGGGGGGVGGGDSMMSCCRPSPSKGGPWKALLITTCDETGRTKTAVQKITAWELWVNLKYNSSAHPTPPSPPPLLPFPPPVTHTHTRMQSATNVNAHLCLLWQRPQVAWIGTNVNATPTLSLHNKHTHTCTHTHTHRAHQ